MRFLNHRSWNPEFLLLLASLCMLLAGNRHFLNLALTDRPASETSTWLFGAALVVALLALNYLLLGMLAWGRLFKPMVIGVLLTTAATAHFIDSFGTLIDPAMLRNALNTHWSESSELLGPSLALALLLGALLPAALIWRLPVARRPWRSALGWRVGTLALALLTALAAIWFVFQPLASLMRSQRDLRYMVTPANLLWSASALAHRAGQTPAGPLAALGRDASAGISLTQTQRPRVVVLVVGETARAANWGLNGYARQTTPELARVPGLISFTQVDSCGTNTEVSLPCMFAPVGRRDYDEARIRGSESLLHVLARAGIAVQWRDNQSGCKGVCEGLPYEEVASLNPAGLCSAGHCLDEGLLLGLDERLTRAAGQQGSQLLVLHQLGNHGPAYFRRYPPAFAQFKPVCEYDDLQRCSQAEIVNAYDNALLYTDHLLAGIVHKLQAAAANVDSLLLYVSDHGESLGENNLWLHGMPYPIAPDVQKRVPMLMWLSAGAPQALALDAGCLQRRAAQPASHDHLFHTLLGVFDVRTALHEPAWDLGAGCRAPVPGP